MVEVEAQIKLNSKVCNVVMKFLKNSLFNAIITYKTCTGKKNRLMQEEVSFIKYVGLFIP